MKLLSMISCAASLLAPQIAWGLDLTQCGQRVPRGTTTVLQADLDCPPVKNFCGSDLSPCTTDADCPGGGQCFGVGVVLENNATLELNGYTLKGAFDTGVRCERHCSVIGSGRIEGTTQPLVVASRNVGIENVTLDGGNVGVMSERGSIRAVDVSSTNAVFHGIYSLRRVRAVNVTVSGSGLIGIRAHRLVGQSVTASNNLGRGVYAERANVDGLIANDNVGHGISGSILRLSNSTLTGNTDPDLQAWRRPRLENTVCGRSYRTTDSSWFVCQND